MSRFDDFTQDELYVLKRQAIESSFDIVMSGKYDDGIKSIHEKLLNEIIQAIKEKDND